MAVVNINNIVRAAGSLKQHDTSIMMAKGTCAVTLFANIFYVELLLLYGGIFARDCYLQFSRLIT